MQILFWYAVNFVSLCWTFKRILWILNMGRMYALSAWLQLPSAAIRILIHWNRPWSIRNVLWGLCVVVPQVVFSRKMTLMKAIISQIVHNAIKTVFELTIWACPLKFLGLIWKFVVLDDVVSTFLGSTPWCGNGYKKLMEFHRIFHEINNFMVMLYLWNFFHDKWILFKPPTEGFSKSWHGYQLEAKASDE